MRRTSYRYSTLSVFFVLLSVTSTPAGIYQFFNVADTNSAAPIGNFLSFDSKPAIGEDYTSFLATYAGGSGVFTGNGGQRYVLSKVGDPAPSGTFASFGSPAKLRATAFRGTYTGGSGIFEGIGAPFTTIVKAGDSAPSGAFTSFGTPAMYRTDVACCISPNYDANTTAFRALYTGGSGIFLGAGGALITVVTTSDSSPSGNFTGFGEPDLDTDFIRPTVAFRGIYGGNQGIFTKSNGVITTIATTTSPSPIFSSFGDPSIGGGSIAFRANPGTPAGFTAPESIYSNQNGSLQPVVTVGDAAPAGTFSGFGDPVLTFFGVVFQGTYASGAGSGIFDKYRFFGSGYGPLEAVVKTGDALFGAHVLSVSMGRLGAASSPNGIESRGIGVIAFRYTLDDGRSGVALAIAASAFPEPAGLFMALCGVFVLSCYRFRFEYATTYLLRNRQSPFHTSTACALRSSKSQNASAPSCVAARTTLGAKPASSASCQRGAQRHQRSPGCRPGKPHCRFGVERSLPADFEKVRNSAVITTQTVCEPTSSGPVLQQPSRKKPVMGVVLQAASLPPSTFFAFGCFITPFVEAMRIITPLLFQLLDRSPEPSGTAGVW
jgi:hypothetical protein